MAPTSSGSTCCPTGKVFPTTSRWSTSPPASTDREALPDKKIVIGEAGWPSDGRVKQGSVPSPAFEAAFLREFFELAEKEELGLLHHGSLRPALEGHGWPGRRGRRVLGHARCRGQPEVQAQRSVSSFGEWKVFAAVAAGLMFLIGLAVCWRYRL